MSRIVKKVGERLPKKKEEKEEKGPANSSDILKRYMEDPKLKGDHYNNIVPKNIRFSTGSLKLDSVATLRSGSVVRLLGKGSEMGKSSQAFELARNYMATLPKSKTIYIKAEGRLSPEIQKRTGLQFVTTHDEWVYGSVFVYCGNMAETVFSMLEDILKAAYENSEHICVILDSLDGLRLKADAEAGKSYGANDKVAGVPKITKIMFSRLALPIVHYDALFVVTSQWSSNIKLNPHSASDPRQGGASGGSSIQHQADHVWDYVAKYLILENDELEPDPTTNKILGHEVKVYIRKSADGNSGLPVRIPIKKGVIGKSSIWVSKEVADCLVGWEMIKKTGAKSAWFAWEPDILEAAKEANLELVGKIQGKDNIYSYLENNPPVYDFFYKQVKELLDPSEVVETETAAEDSQDGIHGPEGQEEDD